LKIQYTWKRRLVIWLLTVLQRMVYGLYMRICDAKYPLEHYEVKPRIFECAACVTRRFEVGVREWSMDWGDKGPRTRRVCKKCNDAAPF
jgi:hypothetical protein